MLRRLHGWVQGSGRRRAGSRQTPRGPPERTAVAADGKETEFSSGLNQTNPPASSPRRLLFSARHEARAQVMDVPYSVLVEGFRLVFAVTTGCIRVGGQTAHVIEERVRLPAE